MADSYNKKEREKKRRKRKQDKDEKRKQNKIDGVKSEEFMYIDEDGNLSTTPPDPTKKKKIKLEDIEISIPKRSDMDPADLIRKGTVKFFDEEKRFGFIRENDTNEDFFVHADSLEDEVKEKDKVEFEIGTGPKGLVAINVKLAKNKPKPAPKKEEPAVEEETPPADDTKEAE